MPAGFRSRAERFGVRRSVADYIAGMTDRFLDRDPHGNQHEDRTQDDESHGNGCPGK